MKTRSISLLLILLVVLGNVSNAQVGGLLRKGLNKALNKDTGNKADSSETDAQGEGTQDKSRGQGIGILGGKTSIKHNDEYQFTGRIYMQVETYDKKNVARSDYFIYFNTNKLDAGIEVKIANPEKGEEAIPTVFLFDNDNKCFMMLMQGKDSKTGIISMIPDDSTLTAQSSGKRAPDEKQALITKTGNTRTIAGYRCDEYKIVDPDKSYSMVWMTKDVRIKADKKNWGKSGIPTYYNYPGFENSMMLAMEAFDKKNDPAMKMETKEINENYRHLISTAGYSFIKMNFMQAGKK